MIASVIISCRNEYPSILYTVHCILEDLASFIPLGEFEVILVDNLSDDRNERRGLGGTTDFLKARGMFYNGMIKTFYYPTASNVGARNFGVSKAQGKYVFFSDAHMYYGPGTFKRWIQTIDESGGIVHPAVAWIGSFPPEKGYGYSWKLGEEFKGTWNNYLVGDGNDWFYVPAMGHCSLGVLKSQFDELGGYIENRCYGGGEMYLDTLWWMAGYSSVTEPRINAYHLSSERGYSYVHDDYIHNVFACSYSLGADWWMERTYINYLRKNRKDVLDKLMVEAKRSSEKRRALVQSKAKTTFNGLIVERPWEKKNIEKFGKGNSGFLVFHDTWLKNLSEGSSVAQKFYNESETQKELENFINKYLGDYVYKRSPKASSD